MIIVDLLILAALVYAGYSGRRRGMVLIGFELVSFSTATLVSLVAYRAAGRLISSLPAVTPAMGNVAGFVILWILAEIGCALLVRFFVLPRLTHAVQHSRANRIGGSVLNVVKGLAIVALSLVVFAGLPVSAGTKRLVTDSPSAKLILASTGQLQSWLSAGLGRDLGDSLNFFTVTSDPESEKRIELGFTTTAVSVSPADEDKMLVLVNQERTSRGLSALTLNVQARAVARAYSADMFARGYFSHINPEGKSPFDRMQATGVKFRTAGENLALAPTLTLAHQGLMNSPGHRANILSPKYKSVGIGVVDGGPYGLMITQDFTDR